MNIDVYARSQVSAFNRDMLINQHIGRVSHAINFGKTPKVAL
jgi:hypothetical protein